MTQISEYTDYKKYLLDWLDSRKALQRGLRSAFAQAADCQSAFVSQVLNGKPHFSSEQALGIANFMGLNSGETRYFLTLLQLARAGTAELRKHLRSELLEQRKTLLDLKTQVGETRELTPEEQNLYYSSWLYVVIHMLVTIPQFQNLKAIALALKLDMARVQSAMTVLVGLGLIHQAKDQFVPGTTQMHLPKASPLIRQHHGNLRLKALDHIALGQSDGIHYSTVSSMSVSDAEKLQSKIVEWIAQYTGVVRDSPEETLVGFNVDFYSLI